MSSCAQCGRQFEPTLEGELRCDECAAAGQPAATAERQKGSLTAYLHSPTFVLIAVNVMMFIVTVVLSRSVIQFGVPVLARLGANSTTLSLGGEPWRLFTYQFLHGGLLHLVFNMWALLNLGMLVEILFGRRSAILMYLSCGVAGGLASLWWHQMSTGVGASGSIFGLAGALLPALAFQKNERMRAALRGNLSSIGLFVVYNIAFGAAAARVDNAAHLGGLVCGVALGLLLPSSPGADSEHHLARRGTIFAGTAVVLVVLLFALRTERAPLLDFLRAEDAYRSGRFAQAVELGNRSAARNPNDPATRFLLGMVYMEMGDDAKAALELEKTTELKPDFAAAFTQLCAARLGLGQVKSALDACRRATELEPGDSKYFIKLGLALRVAGDAEASAAAFRKALELNPDGADENYAYGEAMLERGDRYTAVSVFEKALAANPAHKAARFALIQLYASMGETAKAKRLADEFRQSQRH